MRFKNFRPHAIRAVATFGGHSISFESGEERELPKHLHELAYSQGLVPMEDVESMVAKENALKAAQEEQAAAAEEEELVAQERHREALAQASEEADKALAKKRSESAKKAAATRKAKAESKE